jgi:hypothetical protein
MRFSLVGRKKLPNQDVKSNLDAGGTVGEAYEISHQLTEYIKLRVGEGIS